MEVFHVVEKVGALNHPNHIQLYTVIIHIESNRYVQKRAKVLWFGAAFAISSNHWNWQPCQLKVVNNHTSIVHLPALALWSEGMDPNHFTEALSISTAKPWGTSTATGSIFGSKDANKRWRLFVFFDPLKKDEAFSVSVGAFGSKCRSSETKSACQKVVKSTPSNPYCLQLISISLGRSPVPIHCFLKMWLSFCFPQRFMQPELAKNQRPAACLAVILLQALDTLGSVEVLTPRVTWAVKTKEITVSKRNLFSTSFWEFSLCTIQLWQLSQDSVIWSSNWSLYTSKLDSDMLDSSC